MSISDSSTAETMQQRIERVTEDLKCIDAFYNIKISPDRVDRLRKYYNEELIDLRKEDFDSFAQQDKIDYLLLQNYLERDLKQLELDVGRDKRMEPLLPFAPTIINLSTELINETGSLIDTSSLATDPPTALRAFRTITQLQGHLKEWFIFYNGYDPLFTWWLRAPYSEVDASLASLPPVIRSKLVGINPDDKDAIVGEPIGREGLLADLSTEGIPYTPEELITIAETEYTWCMGEMLKASASIGHGNDWHAALEDVKSQHVPPGEQPKLIHALATEATNYLTTNNLVTVPPLAAETWRMTMMSAAHQKEAPFFLGGEEIQVSYPTNTMSHDFKQTSMRSNNRAFSRATVFHELIPGHHLQGYMSARHRPYRRLFATPFSVEGGAMYWELLLWDRGFAHGSAQEQIGMLFWRMHRCVRVVFSLGFHLGRASVAECVEMLVQRVGHERATAEGEVRRSVSGDYTPLYQAAYLLGALQLYRLRGEVVVGGGGGGTVDGNGKVVLGMQEREFHDRVLRENHIPIEFLRALVKGLPLSRDYEAGWRFYDKV
ncbi:hypothetical protein FQN55_002467 [Onygenales sp. PD_40]|nr:hypothetical protein FQN55_002467 [Onygenales sp. PD_40]